MILRNEGFIFICSPACSCSKISWNLNQISTFESLVLFLFLSCYSHEIYKIKTVGLKNQVIILKLQFFWICKIWGNSLKNRYFANNCLIKVESEKSLHTCYSNSCSEPRLLLQTTVQLRRSRTQSLGCYFKPRSSWGEAYLHFWRCLLVCRLCFIQYAWLTFNKTIQPGHMCLHFCF